MTHREDLLGTDWTEVPTPNGWSTAGTADEWPAFTAHKRIKITAVKLVPATDIVGDATNYATVSAENKGTDGTGTDEIASFAFDTATTDDVDAFDEKALTLSTTAADLVIEAGEVVSIKKAVTGTGEAVEGKVRFEYEPVGS